MATDWSSLGWTPTLNFALPNERQLAQSSIADAGKGAEFKFNPTSMNAQLLASLGYTGQGLGSSIPNEFGDTGPQWSDDARTWLANNGYTVGVAHEPGSTPNGRPEYYGLVDRNGQFVAGQDQPTMTMSDSLMEQITPFLMLAGPFASAISTAEGLAAAGGAAGASGGAAGGAAGGASGGAAGAMDYSALFNNPVYTSGVPMEAGASFGGGAGAIGGSASGGAGIGANIGDLFSNLGYTTGVPEAVAGATGGALSSADKAAMYGNSGYGPGMTGAETSAFDAQLAGGAGTGAASGGMSSADKAALYGNEGYGAGMSGTQTSVYDSILNATGSKGLADLAANSTIGSGLLDGIKGAADLVGGGQNLAGLVGAIGGAAGGSSGDQVSSRDPWAAAQPFLKAVLGDAGNMLTNLRQQPYTPQQTQQYQQAFAGLDQARSALPGLLNWGQSAMQRQSTVPSYQQLFGGGLLGQQQPTAQAGGAGGLLGNDDRIKALMARGQGLIG